MQEPCWQGEGFQRGGSLGRRRGGGVFVVLSLNDRFSKEKNHALGQIFGGGILAFSGRALPDFKSAEAYQLNLAFGLQALRQSLL